MNNFDPTNNISWQFGHRGRVAVFIDGNNLFHAARFHNIDIDYNKLLRVLLGDGRLLRAFFYTGVDVGAERQQGFLLWMRRNGFRVIQKELKTFYDGTRKANLDVEIAVDMHDVPGASAYMNNNHHEPNYNGHRDEFQPPPSRITIEPQLDDEIEQFDSPAEFIRVTDEH